jgi:hypothetical protein
MVEAAEPSPIDDPTLAFSIRPSIRLEDMPDPAPTDSMFTSPVGSGFDRYPHLVGWVRNMLNPKHVAFVDASCFASALGPEGQELCKSKYGGGWNANTALMKWQEEPVAGLLAPLTQAADAANANPDILAIVWPAIEIRMYRSGFGALTSSSVEPPLEGFLTREAADRVAAISIEPLPWRKAAHCYVARPNLGLKSIGLPYPTSFHVRDWNQIDQHLRWVSRSWALPGRKLAFLYATVHPVDRGEGDGNSLRRALSEQCQWHGSDCTVREGYQGSTNYWVHRQLREHTFCLEPAGDSPSRSQIIECLLVGAIPVFFSSCLDDDLFVERMYTPFLPAHRRTSYGAGDWAVVLDATRTLQDPNYAMKALSDLASDTEIIDAMRQKILEVIPHLIYPVPNSPAGSLQGLKTALGFSSMPNTLDHLFTHTGTAGFERSLAWRSDSGKGQKKAQQRGSTVPR